MTARPTHAGGLVTALLAGACGGTETGNPVAIELRVHAHSSDPSQVAVGVGNGGAVVTGTWLAAGGLAFAACDAPVVSSPVLPAGDYAGGTAPRLDLAIDPGDICDTRLTLGIATLTGDAPTALVGHTVLVVGDRADRAPFQIRVARPGTLIAPPAAGMFSVDEDGSMFLGFDVARWFAGVDLDGAIPDVDGRILIDETTDPARAAAFELALPLGVELYRDLDRNGRVDPPGDVLLAAGDRIE